MAGQDHAVIPIADAASRADPLEPAIRDARAALSVRAPQAPTGVTRSDYLRMVDGIVRHFAPFQDQSGAIIDPYAHREIQYSTPSYALAAAMLVHSGMRPELLNSASRALDRSINALATRCEGTRTSTFGRPARSNSGSHACGSICRRDRNTFQVTASSLFSLRRCSSLPARMEVNTGS